MGDVRASNGAMQCIPGWHKMGIFPVCDQGHPDFTAAINTELMQGVEGSTYTYELDAGQACVNHPLMPHCSGPNRSSGWRRALVLRYRQPVIPQTVDWSNDFRTGLLFGRQSYRPAVRHAGGEAETVAGKREHSGDQPNES